MEYVSGPENASFIIDLSTSSSRGGVRDRPPGGQRDRGIPGHFNLYYRNLADNPGGRQSITLTAAHELCHYFFGLPDEYLQSGQVIPRCPTAPGLGCLMDNYQPGGRFVGSPGGWLGRLCSPQEHTITPEFGYYTGVAGSCQTIIAAFFREVKNPGDPDFDSLPDNPPFSPGTVVATPSKLAQMPVVQKAATSPRLKDRLAGLLKLRPGGLLNPDDVKGLLGDARQILLSSVEGAKLSNSDLEQAAQVALGIALGKPPRLAAIEGILVDEAKSLRTAFGQPKTQAAIQDIVSKLIRKARTQKEIGGTDAAPANTAFSPEELAFLSNVAAGTEGGNPAATPTIASGKPGTGVLQTVIYTPQPIKAQVPGYPADLVKTQGDPLASYSKISKEGVRVLREPAQAQ